MTDHENLDRLGELLSRQDIYDVIKQVSRAIDRFDEALFVSGFHADAVIEAGAMVEQPVRVYAIGAELHDTGQISTLHHLTNHSCDIDGDVAHAETYFFYVGRNRDDINWAAGGRYADRLERRDGKWKIAFRCTILEWSGTMPAASVPLFANVPDLLLNGVPGRTRQDPSYQRPLVNRRARNAPARPSDLSQPGT
jgi:hypothetical protein